MNTAKAQLIVVVWQLCVHRYVHVAVLGLLLHYLPQVASCVWVSTCEQAEWAMAHKGAHSKDVVTT